MEYKLIKKFLPELSKVTTEWNFGTTLSNGKTITDKKEVSDFILASELEAELAKGVEVFGNDEEIDNAEFTSDEVKGVDTHSGLLIGYQPLESSKPVSREEILELLADLSSSMSCSTATKVRLETEIKLTNEIRKRILENGVK